MAQQLIGIGTLPNDGTGDPLRTAGEKINDNFTELYTLDALPPLRIGTGGQFLNIGAAVAAGAIVITTPGSTLHTSLTFVSDVTESGDVVFPNTTPSANARYDITINGNGFRWTLGNTAFTRTGTLGTYIKTLNTNIICGKTSGGTHFAASGVGGTRISCTGGEINCAAITSGVFQTYVNSNLNKYIDCTITLNNAGGGGLSESVQSNSTTIIGCNIVGGGASCAVILSGLVSGCSVTGTFLDTAQSGFRIDGYFTGNTVSITGRFSAIAGKLVNNNITASAGITFYTLFLSATNNQFNSAVTYGTGGAATHYMTINGNYFASTFAPSRPTQCTGNYFVGAVTSTSTFQSSNNTFISTFSSSSVLSSQGDTFTGNVTITGANVSKVITGNIVGAGGAGGGTATLTLSAGVNRAIVKNNHFDNDLVDNSGEVTNIIADNITY
jgi:hypothetical protein